MLKNHAKNWKEVMDYATSIRDGTKVACKYQKLGVERFFRDLENDRYEFMPDDADFCINIIEISCHI